MTIIKNCLFEKILKRHKQLIGGVKDITTQKEMGVLGKIQTTALKLCLFTADFKCEHKDCDVKKDLTLHHLILRNTKEFMDFKRYLAARNYWNNQIILCRKHHCKIHRVPDNKLMLTIDKAKINAIKKEFKGGEK